MINTSNRVELVTECVCFVNAKLLVRLRVCTYLNSNPKSPDRQEVGEEVVLCA